MRKVFFITFLMIYSTLYSQNLPTSPAQGFAFPIGSKFTIKLYPLDSVNFNFSIIKFESFQQIIDTDDNDSLFKGEDKNGTIEFYFTLSTIGKTKREKEKNRKVVLLMHNRTEYNLSYESDIMREEDGEFEETSNVGAFSGAKGKEIWPYMIYQIGLHDFKRLK